jgi:hypothetical protein
MRLFVSAACFCLVALSGCSSSDLAAFNVGLQEAAGTYWPDQAESQALECASGDGYLIEYSGVMGGEGYVYFESYADNYASITVTYADGDVYDMGLDGGETSDAIYKHPGYGWTSSWSC